MVRPVETIRREIDSLNQATVDLAAEFNRLYTSYLDSLGLALRHQVIMAAYHLCTQVYPEGFLDLSVNQREQLQSRIRQLGHSGATWLQQLMEPSAAWQARLSLEAIVEPHTTDSNSADSDEIPEQDFSNPTSSHSLQPELESQADEDAEDADYELTAMEIFQDANESLSEDDFEDAEQADQANADALPLPSILKSMVMAALAEEMSDSLGDRLFAGDDLTPTRLAKQHIFIEQQIREVLQRVSKQANHLLQAAEVIPNLPEAVLDAASETEVGSSRGRSVPNVLNVMVAISANLDENLGQVMNQSSRNRAEEEEDDDEDDEDEDELREGMMTHLAAINLRLSDIEFADVQASLWRGRLRNALGQLRKLGKQYQKAQREMAISEAEQAWRAVWYDDSPR
jgi:chorismate mutase